MANSQPEPKAEPPLPGKFKDALDGMRDRVFLAGLRYQEQQQRCPREGAHPDLVGGVKPSTSPGRWVECRGFVPVFIRRMEALGVPMFAHCIWRKGEVQDDLERAGRSKAKAGQSPHNFGCAVDLVHGIEGWNLSDQQWALVGHVGKEVALSLGVRLEWGGDWKFYDPAHWELRDWRVIRGVFQSDPSISTVPQALDRLAAERSQL